jgi:hypothetical protein
MTPLLFAAWEQLPQDDWRGKQPGPAMARFLRLARVGIRAPMRLVAIVLGSLGLLAGLLALAVEWATPSPGGPGRTGLAVLACAVGVAGLFLEARGGRWGPVACLLAASLGLAAALGEAALIPGLLLYGAAMLALFRRGR